MEKLALRVAGFIFAAVAGMHIARITMKLPVTVGVVHVPLRMSAVATVVTLFLAFWMFWAAAGQGKK